MWPVLFGQQDNGQIYVQRLFLIGSKETKRCVLFGGIECLQSHVCWHSKVAKYMMHSSV
jgi:hypothetical protein